MNKLLRQLELPIQSGKLLIPSQNTGKKPYDPELLYVECRACGRPVLWEPGRTTALLIESKINPQSLDEHCLILSEGCRECNPETGIYHLSIVRLSNIPLNALLLMQKIRGHA